MRSLFPGATVRLVKVFVRCTYTVPSFLNRSRLPSLMVVPPAGNNLFQIIYRVYKRFIKNQLPIFCPCMFLLQYPGSL